MNQSKIRECFNRSLTTYDNHCDIQTQTGIKLIKDLKDLNLRPNSIVDLGCGTGITTEHLASLYENYYKFYAIDIADKLLLKAKDRLEKYNIITLEKSLEDFLGNEKILFDLVFYNMVLQWSNNLDDVLKKIYQKLNLGGGGVSFFYAFIWYFF
jgi:malonyl-CoA O-methyltransferase